MTFHFLHLKNWSIFEQLQLEEALLRVDDRNFLIISEGSIQPSVVMGISSKIDQHVDLAQTKEHQIPVIRRFSGGGTVVVNKDTLFVTFIGTKQLLTSATPESIMLWAEELLRPAFAHDLFRLRENDFVLGERKCGGNAQYLQKERFLIHTSFLWDFQPEQLNYLRHPPKMPTYRNGRGHNEFVCKISEYLPCKLNLIEQIKREVSSRFTLQMTEPEELNNVVNAPHRRATVIENTY